MRSAVVRILCVFLATTGAWSCGGGGGGSTPGADSMVDVPDVVPLDLGTDPGQDVGGDTHHDVTFTDSALETSQDDGVTDPGATDQTTPEVGDVADTGTDVAPDESDPGPPPCTQDTDCDDGDPCTLDACDTTQGQCLNQPVPCDPGLDCFTGTCGGEGSCSYAGDVSDDCFIGAPVLADDFETLGLDIWVVEDLAQNQLPGDEIVWAPTDLRSHSGNGSLYFGDPESQDYDTGKVVASNATSVPLDLTGAGRATLVFWVWADVEDGDLWDVLSVAVLNEMGAIPVWTKGYGFPMKTWTPVTVDLSAFSTGTFQVVFTFNSVEHSFNDTEGLYIDDVFVLLRHPQPTCTGDDECDDGIPCTEDSCQEGACLHDFSSGCCSVNLDCDDFDACTVDLCKDGGCEHIAVADPLCCNTDWDCDDNNHCTEDVCGKNQCKYSVLAEPGCCTTVSQCDDVDPCTLDQCEANQCLHHNFCCYSDEECDDNDPVCTDDSCVDGKCLYQPTGGPGCCAPTIASFAFDEGGYGWTYSPSAGGVGWQVVTGGQTKSVSAPGALYYGDPQSWDFDNGNVNGGSAWSPEFMMQPGYPAAFSAQVYMDTESGSTYDKLWVRVVSDGVPTVTIWTKSYVSTGQFFELTANLSAWAGKTIQIKFDFDTYDSLINGGLGVFIDDVEVTTPCQPQSCNTDGDCNDGISASKDTCSGGTCVWEL